MTSGVRRVSLTRYKKQRSQTKKMDKCEFTEMKTQDTSKNP